MSIKRAFTEHPASVGETYFEHLRRAMGFSVRMVAGGLACFVHALLPWLHTRTGSDTICALHDCMVVNRQSQKPAAPQSGVKAPAV
jgi:Family of unknown function (DUF6356)